jgi:hypothetical protein
MHIPRKYLPSDHFIARSIIIVVIVVGLFGVYHLGRFIIRSIWGSGDSKILIKELVEQDSNKNGIADWEERLWGLDPTKHGDANKKVILAKKEALGSLNTENQEPLTENEKMAREFFVLVTSLTQTGNLTDEAIAEIADSIGKQAVAEPIPDIYTKDSIKTNTTTPASIRAYHTAFTKLAVAYSTKDIGNELGFISQAIDHNDPKALYAAITVGREYKAFAEELIKIPTPTSLAVTTVALANNYYKTGLSIDEIGKLMDDQLAGMRGIVNYKKYTDGIIANLETMKTFFERNGILK